MKQALYDLLLAALLPYALWRAFRLRRQMATNGLTFDWKTLFAVGLCPDLRRTDLWIHALSLGESRSVIALVERLLCQHPRLDITVSNTTISGFMQIRGHFGDRLMQCYMPYDYAAVCKRFIAHLQPRLAVMVETEIWPNLLSACARNNLRIVMINARLTRDSRLRYQRLGRHWIGSRVNMFHAIYPQSEMDSRQFVQLGLDRAKLSILGNLKFDNNAPDGVREEADKWRSDHAAQRWIWTAGSIQKGREGRAVVDVYRAMVATRPDVLLVIAPRKMESCAALIKQLQDCRLRYQLCSTQSARVAGITKDCQVVVVDVFGELSFWYAVADAAFIGGSLFGGDGQNPIEAAVMRTPVLAGRHVREMESIYDEAFAAGAVWRVDSEDQLKQQLRALLASPQLAADQGEQAFRFVAARRGACGRYADEVSRLLRR